MIDLSVAFVLFISMLVYTRRPIATAADRVDTDHFQKSQSQDGGLPELLLAYSCLTNHSEAASLSLVVFCCNVEYLNSSMQNLRPSVVKVNRVRLAHSLDNSDSCPTGVAHFLFPLF